LLLDGLSVLVIEGRAAAAPKLRRVLSLVAEGEIATAEALRWGWMATIAPRMLWDLENWQAVNDRLRQTAQEAGLLVHLPIYLHSLGSVAVWRGDFAMAGSLIAEADAIAEATGARLIRSAPVMLAAWRGQEAQGSALIDVEARNTSAVGQGFGIQYCQWVGGVLYNGLGRYEKALGEAQQAREEAPELWTSACALVEVVEAAARTGKTRVAGAALERLGEAAIIGDSDWGLGVLARSRALVSERDDAEASYREGIERLSRTQLRPELARGHLIYGEWLRRENRRVDARVQLRVAHDLFTSIGMEGFAERARGELQATGEHVRAHTVETRDDLTAQERQIAELARDGLTNPEIGARLFLSPRTVEWHLRHVFTQLGSARAASWQTRCRARTSNALSPEPAPARGHPRYAVMTSRVIQLPRPTIGRQRRDDQRVGGEHRHSGEVPQPRRGIQQHEIKRRALRLDDAPQLQLMSVPQRGEICGDVGERAGARDDPQQLTSRRRRPDVRHQRNWRLVAASRSSRRSPTTSSLHPNASLRFA